MLDLGKLDKYKSEVSELNSTIVLQTTQLEEKNMTIEKLEGKIQDMERRHQKEIKLQYMNMFNNVSEGDHLNTYTHRKMKKGEKLFKGSGNHGHVKSGQNNGTPISISYK